ncbi:MAG: outer membrane protein transport protein [Luteolibacter sp.]
MKRFFPVGLIVWSAAGAAALANGFYIPVQAPEATGRGNAWLATADTASAVYYNAAGLTQQTSANVVVGSYAVLLGLEAETASGNFENDKEWSFLPQIYAALPVNDRLVAGFGINTPFGLSTSWGDETPFRQIATETELKYVTSWLVLGFKVTDSFSVGGGIGVHYADATIQRGLFVPGDYFKFEGDDEALSWTVSARWQPAPEHAFGLVYRSKTEFTLDGSTENTYLPGSQKASLDFITPATAGAGYAYRPCREWLLEANIEWVNWDELNDLTLSSGGTDTDIAFDWNSNFIYSAGFTRFFDGGWNASLGYNYIENSQPNATFNPGISDANRHWLNIGCGQDLENFKWSLAYQFAFSDRDVSGSPGGLADGTYKSRFHGLMANCRWSF